jgi:hypothetical protein
MSGNERLKETPSTHAVGETENARELSFSYYDEFFKAVSWNLLLERQGRMFLLSFPRPTVVA